MQVEATWVWLSQLLVASHLDALAQCCPPAVLQLKTPVIAALPEMTMQVEATSVQRD